MDTLRPKLTNVFSKKFAISRSILKSLQQAETSLAVSKLINNN